ncbi:ribosome maturation factor RimP [Thiovibrio frasassiensis]|uniref:Ribosome maturation factor RimP n=1 Tax=Thiovibrio frasassiensis TaxID=2984131 RepID=A0A9X4MCD7_9BACT|nr:ribosome maturation factor RimP [Thiovibrio frasassiensis]MDG4474886.1 ribosome maturation factor RimP [Thiovibrio frasassiensis]
MEEEAIESPLVHRLTQLVVPVVEDLGCELVELQFRREGHGWVLRLLIDNENGVGIDDCARISREVAHLLEVEDPIEQAYSLEVSSPGLDRPLKCEKDFLRCKGKKAKVVVREPIEGQNQCIGLIEDVTQESVTLGTDHGIIEIPFAKMKKARLVVEF